MVSPSNSSPGRQSVEPEQLNSDSPAVNNNTNSHEESKNEFLSMQQTMLAMMSSMQTMMQFMMGRTAVPLSGIESQFRHPTVPTSGTGSNPSATSVNEEQKLASHQLFNDSMTAQTPLKPFNTTNTIGNHDNSNYSAPTINCRKVIRQY